jgi:hypothetical protein
LILLVFFESGGTDGDEDVFNQTAVAFAARLLGSCTWLWLRNKAFEDNREIGRTYVSFGSFASLLTYLQHVRYPAHLGPETDVANTGIGVIQAPEPEPRIMRYELTDFEWTAIRPFLPNKPRGVPRVNDRRVLNGIIWILRSGAPWRDLPEGFGPYTTCYNRFVRWRTAGICPSKGTFRMRS